MEKKEDFYHELDSKGKRSFCTCQMLALFLVVLAVLGATGIAIAVKKVTTAVAPQRTVTATRSDSANLQQKMQELATAPGASTTVTITEQELTGLLAEAVSKSPNFPLRGVQAEINPDGIVLTGTAVQYLNSSLSITVQPKVVEGRPKLELVKIQAGSLAVPNALTNLIAQQLEGLLTEQLSTLGGITVKSIMLNEGRMTLSGTVGTSSPSDPS